MKLFLANPRGFCAGVRRAINIVNYALLVYGPPIYVRNEIVHNSYVVNNLLKKGVIFVKKISDVPDNSVLIFSAHGVSKSVKKEAYSRNFKKIFDATCPLVSKVHMCVARASRKNGEVILIGSKGHPEIDGIIGQYENSNGGIYLISNKSDISNLKIKNTNNLFFVTQTTLSIIDTYEIINALKNKFPNIIFPYKNNICYATMNRQETVRKLSKKVDIILVVGSKNSSNSNSLVNVAKKLNTKSYLINSFCDIKDYWLKNINSIAITSGASAPEELVKSVVNYLKVYGISEIVEFGKNEKKMFF